MAKKIFMIGIVCAFIANVQAQTTYDVFTFSKPAGFLKDEKKDFISFTKTNNKTGDYCIISLYKQTPGSKNLVIDFKNDWKELVIPIGVTDTAQTENGDDINGWKTYNGAASFKYNDGTSMAILTTARKDNSSIAILIITNSQEMVTKDVDPFLASIKLKNPTKIIQAAIENKDSSNLKVSQSQKNILGEWYLSDGNAKITLLFAASGIYDKGSLVDRRIFSNLHETTKIKGRGKYTISGNTLILYPLAAEKEIYQYRFSAYKNDEGKIIRILHLKRPLPGKQIYESDYYFVK